MNKIITISREFGSGGRALGKMLAEKLHIAYYDSEIVKAIAERSSLAESYVKQVVERRIETYYPISIGHTFNIGPSGAMNDMNRAIYSAQTDVVHEMAEKSDCVIVGRCADHILEDMKPLNIFCYADLGDKIKRCRERGGEEISGLSEKELVKMIQQVDKNRARYYASYTGNEWGNRLRYDMCVNTSKRSLEEICEAVTSIYNMM